MYVCVSVSLACAFLCTGSLSLLYCSMYVQEINLSRLQLLLLFFWLFKNLRPLPELCYPDLNGPTIGLWDVLLLLVEVVRLPVVYGDGEWAPEGNQHSAYCGQCGRRRQPEAQDADTAWT